MVENISRKLDGSEPRKSTCDGIGNYSGSRYSKPRGYRSSTTLGHVREIISSPHPIPYTFRVPAPSLQMCRRQHLPQTTRAPPFCLQLDHTLAVLWTLFRKKAGKPGAEEIELGIGQLQWALYFLKGIKSPNGGDRAEDVAIAIQAVEDALLDLYADMSHLVLQTPRSVEPQEAESAQIPDTNISCTVCSEVRRPMNVISPEDWVPSTSVGPCGKCTSSTLGDGMPRRSSRRSHEAESIGGNKIFKCGIDTSRMAKEIEQQNMGSPWAKKSKENAENLLQDPQLTEEILHLRSMASELNKRTPTPTDVSQITMLQEWRKEQMNRVESELERLKNLDNVLGVASNADAALNIFRNRMRRMSKLTPDENTAESSVMNTTLNSFTPTQTSSRNEIP